MRFAAIVVLFASFSALACPNLAGRYARCTSATGQSASSTDLVISQSVSGGVTTYVLTETDEAGNRSATNIVADGRPQIETDESTPEMPVTSTTVVSCRGNALVMNSAISSNGEGIGNISVTISRSGNRVAQVVDGMVLGAEIADTITCQ